MDIKSFVLGLQAGKNAGGGSGGGDTGGSEYLRWVTFMSHDGGIEYGKKAVAVGDDCADPIARGLFDTPTRESTAQYDFSFVGWATTPNGAWDESALDAVTEDKTVYAAYASAVRYYTITYLDSDGVTVLKTESLAYGATPSYTAEKEGYGFDGWSPEISTVTGNASYIARWTEIITFANASWAKIAEISESGRARECFNVGDTKEFSITYANGNTGTLKIAIAGFDHDDLSDGSGKAGISMVCMTLPNITSLFWGYKPTYAYQSAYTDSNCKIRTALSGTVYNVLPEALRNVIKNVSKTVDNTIDSTSSGQGTTKVDAPLWLLSAHEMGHNGEATTNFTVLGTRYELFLSANIATSTAYLDGTPIEGTTNYPEYWTRNYFRVGAAGLRIVSQEGSNHKGYIVTKTGDSVQTARYIRFGFCI